MLGTESRAGHVSMSRLPTDPPSLRRVHDFDTDEQSRDQETCVVFNVTGHEQHCCPHHSESEDRSRAFEGAADGKERLAEATEERVGSVGRSCLVRPRFVIDRSSTQALRLPDRHDERKGVVACGKTSTDRQIGIDQSSSTTAIMCRPAASECI